MRSPLPFHLPSLRRQFDRRAAHSAKADFVLREVEARMLERLDLIRLQPQQWMDLGCGVGPGVRALRARFAQAQAIGVDLSPGMLAQAQKLEEAARPGWLTALGQRVSGKASPPAQWLLASADALPVADSQLDLVWSNLALHWFNDPAAVFAECRRVLRAEGLLMMSSFGVDTAQELRALGVQLPTFQDMHDIGDALVHAGFADPVVDMEKITFTYSCGQDLLNDVRALGGNALSSRRAGLHTPRQKAGWLQALEQTRCLTIEVVYVHAWLPAKSKVPEGYSPIGFMPRRG